MKLVNTPEDVLVKSGQINDKEEVLRLYEKHASEVKDWDEPEHKSQWCPGCGNFAILLAFKKAMVSLQIRPEELCIVSGIGQAGKFPHYVKCYGVETLHGRALPVATGVKLANKDVNVVVVGGDGDGFGLGMGHFVHSARRNLNVTYLIHNNEIYGLTKGQTSPTSPKGTKTVSTPNGSIETPIHPVEQAITNGATFVARCFAGDMEQTVQVMAAAMKHKGFAIVEMLQPCISYNPSKNHQFFKQRCFRIEESEDYNPTNKHWSLALVHREKAGLIKDEKIPCGILYHNDGERSTYLDELPESAEIALVKQDISNVNIEDLLDKFE